MSYLLFRYKKINRKEKNCSSFIGSYNVIINNSLTRSEYYFVKRIQNKKIVLQTSRKRVKKWFAIQHSTANIYSYLR